jgi:hypothetical protein
MHCATRTRPSSFRRLRSRLTAQTVAARSRRSEISGYTQSRHKSLNYRCMVITITDNPLARGHSEELATTITVAKLSAHCSCCLHDLVISKCRVHTAHQCHPPSHPGPPRPTQAHVRSATGCSTLHPPFVRQLCAAPPAAAEAPLQALVVAS